MKPYNTFTLSNIPLNDISEKWDDVKQKDVAIQVKSASTPETPPVSLERYPSMEYLHPSHDSPLRKSGILIATFNLIASIIGGGVLSLPLSFQKAGIIPATILMIFGAVVTDFSLYILCSCSRRTPSRSFGEIGLYSFGPGLEMFANFTVALFLLFVLVGFMVLVRDIWTPIVDSLILRPILQHFHRHNESSFQVESTARGDIVLLVILFLLTPFFLRTDLHALRYNCYVGFASYSILCIAIVYRAYEKYIAGDMTTALNDDNEENNNDELIWFTYSFTGILYAFPIITLTFVSSFNMISIQAALIKPTRKRIRRVIDGAVGGTFLLYYVFGLAGYLYARDDTKGNILLNFPFDDWVILLGRAGSGITIVLAMPMFTLPCREVLMELGPQLRKWNKSLENEGPLQWDNVDKMYFETISDESEVKHDIVGSKESDANEMDFVTSSYWQHLQNHNELIFKDFQDATDEHSPLVQKSDETSRKMISSTSFKDKIIYTGCTFCIVFTCYCAAVAAPSVATVWTLCGSSMAFFIGFIYPSVCYIKIRSGKKSRFNVLIVSAWALLIFSLVGALACTIYNIWKVFFSRELR